nr:reverse transcriptase domain-containing protein [Tanacetum cinerariifolium]
MSTHSSARNLFPPLDNPELPIRRRSRADPTLLNDIEMATEGNGDPPVPDLRTMKEFCQPTLNGWGGLIAPIAIQATNFGLKNDMIQQFENSCQFHGLSGDDANKHLDKFLHVTQSIKVNGVTDAALRLYLFPHSLTHHATAWFDRLPRNSINTFEKMAKMFLGKYFPPSMVTKLRNEITNFCQHPDDSLFEAWERYKLSIDRCPNHNMLAVTHIDTFYKGLTLRHHDTVNAATGGTFMKRCPEECYDLIENITAHHNDWDTSTQQSESSSSITSSFDSKSVALKAKMEKINKNLMKVLQINQQVKALTPSCETCGGPHSYNDCLAIVGQTQNIYTAGAYQGGNSYQPQGASHGPNPPSAYQAPAYQSLGYHASVHQPSIPQPQVVTTTEFTNYMKANDAILKNMQTNMTSLKNSNLELKNMFGQFMNMNTALSSGSRTLLSNTVTNPKEDLKGITTRSGNAYQGPTIPTTLSSSPSKVVERKTEVPKDTVPYTNNGSTKDIQPSVVQIETPILNSEPVVAPVSAPKPNQKPSIPYPSRLHDQKLRDKANDQKEKIFQIFKDINFNISFANALIFMPKFGPTIKSLLTNKDKLFELARTLLNEHCSTVLLKKLPEKLGDPDKFLIPCDFPEMNECLALADLGASINLMPLSVWNKLSLPKLNPTLMTLELADRSISRPIGVVDFDADPRVPLILGRSFLKTGRALIDEVVAFLALEDDPTSPEVDHSYYDTKGDILLLEAFLNDDPSLPPPTQGMYLSQIQKVIKIYEAKNEKSSIDEPPEVELKDLSPHLEYVFLEGDDKLPVIIAKDLSVKEKSTLIKGGFTVVENEENELIPTRLVTGWRVCIDYRKLNEATRKDHFPHPFMDYMLERLARNEYYCFLRHVPKVYDGYLSRYDRKMMEVFMDDFSIFGNSFGTCLSYLEKMLKRCEDTNLCLNWEKSHFMVKEGIVLGHKISKNGIKVDKAKVDIAWLMTRLLEKDTSFFFSKECVEAFQTLKRKLTEAPILVSSDWDLPFELMCDASDFAIGAVPGKQKTKHFQPIHYASKTMTDAQAHYTTTEKELLAVVYAFEKFQPYLVLSKSIVYTNHSALKYLFNKQDAKPRLFCWVLLLQEFDITVHDKKKDENLATNHFSRLENPHQSVLDKKEINETFPLETLNVVSFRGDSDTPCITSGTTPSCSKSVQIKSSSNVFMARKQLKLLRLAIMDPLRDIMARTTSPKRCLTPDSIGPQSIVMPTTWSNLVTLVNVRERLRNEMKCLKIPSKFVKFSTFGASISWGHSHLHEGTSIYLWPFGTPHAIISNRDTHFYNDQFAKVMLKYGVTHRLATVYHPQTSGHVEVSNRGFKKNIGKDSRREPCLLTAGDHRKVQLNELNELRDQAYENSLIYKEKTKRLHDSKIKDRVFNVGDRVLLFNSRLKIFSGKLKTRWSRPFFVGPLTLADLYPLN